MHSQPKKFGSHFGSLLRRLWGHLSGTRRRQFFGLALLLLLSALAELLSFGAVIPFIGALTQPERVLAHPLVGKYASLFGVHDSKDLALPLTLMFAVAAVFAGWIRIRLLKRNSWLAFATGADLSTKVYQRTLYQPYSVHVSRNSSEIISTITTKVTGSVSTLYHLLTLISSSFLLIAITIALVFIDPLSTMGATLFFGIFYGTLSFIHKKKLKRNSEIIAQNQTQVIKTLQEGLGGIRDILLDGTQEIYCDAYRKADEPFRAAQGNVLYLTGSPRFSMEAIGLVLIAALAYAFSISSGGIVGAFATLGALAIGAQRLLPVLQQAYNAWGSIQSNHASLEHTLALLDQPIRKELETQTVSPLPFQHKVTFDQVSFRYHPDGAMVLQQIAFDIPKGARVGITGTTGSGKSTLIDLLMGLLEPTGGQIKVDSVTLNAQNLRAWQKNIAHVPQAIFLADETIAENIAFGVEKKDIDLARVEKAAKLAKIEDWILKNPAGYQTPVGERGIRLSGGQRQRLGIARALYKQSKVVVFDEATSALDQETEKAVMEAIDGLDSELTVILIAHRISTLQNCDFIIQLEHGRVLRTGTFQQIFGNVSP